MKKEVRPVSMSYLQRPQVFPSLSLWLTRWMSLLSTGQRKGLYFFSLSFQFKILNFLLLFEYIYLKLCLFPNVSFWFEILKCSLFDCIHIYIQLFFFYYFSSPPLDQSWDQGYHEQYNCAFYLNSFIKKCWNLGIHEHQQSS